MIYLKELNMAVYKETNDILAIITTNSPEYLFSVLLINNKAKHLSTTLNFFKKLRHCFT